MKKTPKQEYSYTEFLETFFSVEGSVQNETSSPYEIGISISQSTLAFLDKSIQEAVKLPSKEKITTR